MHTNKLLKCMYEDDRPNQYVVDIELSSWKCKWLECDEILRSKTIVSSLKKFSKDMDPNLSMLQKFATTLPVTSCKSEKSSSFLQPLRIWLRAFYKGVFKNFVKFTGKHLSLFLNKVAGFSLQFYYKGDSGTGVFL